ncbi:tyrosine-type recombinase/integrase [Skermanella mucosa]|uniref:site-specific integrase n=1 Tax=Skermanella mucosa TaxID=1789672 RepID=UPI00192CC004|nr:site-specific integrase [Skermanella mucosa]UEM18455.1 tyrosine-type recombinase/integrase [Skermanella mucosa]
MSQPPSLADLDVVIHIAGHAGVLSKATRHAARKALVRVSVAEGRDLADAPQPDVRLRHAALAGTINARALRDEQAALRQAEVLPLLPADLVARISTGEATLDDAIAVVMRQESWGAERVRIAGAVTRLAAIALARFGRADLRATESVVDDLLARLTHGDFGLEPGSWSAFKSRVRRAVRLVDVHARQRLSESMLTGPWRLLLGAVKRSGDASRGDASRGDLAKVWPLVAFCHRRSIPPEAVDDAVIGRLRQELDARSRNAFDVARNVVYGWERLQKAHPEWPATRLSRLYARAAANGDLRFEDLPEPLRQSWAAFIAEFGAPRDTAVASLADLILDDDDVRLGTAPSTGDSLSAARLLNLRTVIVHAANVAIAQLGLMPASIEDLVTADIARRALKRIARRQVQTARDRDVAVNATGMKNGYLLHAATGFVTLARCLEMDDVMDDLVQLRDDVDPRLIRRKIQRDGSIRREYAEVQIGPRHRERLAQFRADTKLLAWFEVLDELIRRSETVAASGRLPTLEDVGDMIVCVLHAITRCCPMRRRNLTQLRILGPDRNLVLPPKHGVGYLHVDWQEVKNRRAIDVEIPEEYVRVLRRWIDVYRPALMRAVGADSANPYLFPAAGMAHRAPTLLNSAFVDRNRKIGGFELNLHLQRHLAAKIVLDQEPESMPLVQELLGHKKEQTTRRYYAEINSILVQRRYHDLLLGRLRTLRFRKGI